MAFKYINPGFADLFDEVSVNCNQYYNNANSRTSGDCFSIPNDVNALYLERNKEYWIAMSNVFYAPYNIGYIYIIDATVTQQATNSNNYISIEKYKIDGNRFSFQLKKNGNIIYKDNKALYYTKMYHFEFYIKDDPVNGEIKVWVDGELFLEYKGSTGTGNGYNRLEISTANGFDSYEYISDLVVQNTGRIGDIRVNRIPMIPDTCEWNIDIPYGYDLNSTGDSIGNAKDGSSYIVFAILFSLAGKVHNIKLKTNGIKSIQFCLFRKNVNGNYDAVETTKAYTNLDGICDIELETPMNAQINDCLGFYLDGNIVAHSVNKEIYYFISGNATSSTNISVPTQKAQYQPDICAYLTPDNKDEGIQSVKKNGYGWLVTNTIDKKVMNKLSVTDLKIGRIDSIAITNKAKYEGESPVKGIAAVVKSEANEYESSSKAISTSYKNLSLATLDKNPFTGKEWSKSELQNIKLGIKSKA